MDHYYQWTNTLTEALNSLNIKQTTFGDHWGIQLAPKI